MTGCYFGCKPGECRRRPYCASYTPVFKFPPYPVVPTHAAVFDDSELMLQALIKKYSEHLCILVLEEIERTDGGYDLPVTAIDYNMAEEDILWLDENCYLGSVIKLNR